VTLAVNNTVSFASRETAGACFKNRPVWTSVGFKGV